MAASPVTLYVWGYKALGFLPTLAMEVAGIDYIWYKFDGDVKWEDVKPQTPFGQAPFLVHGNIKIGQTGAITRYISRIGGLQGRTDEDFARSEMLLCEYEDIYNQFRKCKYNSGDKVKSWNELLEGWLPTHLAMLEELLSEESVLFTRMGPTVGDLAIFCGINIALDCQPRILDLFPKLQRFYTHVATLPSLQTYFSQPMQRYFEREVAPPPPQVVEAPKQYTSSMPTSDYGPGIHGRRILQAPGGTSTITFG